MEFRAESMILKVLSNNIVEISTPSEWDGVDDLEQAKKNLATMREVMQGKGMGTLAYMPSTYVDKEVLEYYNSHHSGEVASAILTTSFASRLIGNLVLKVSGNRHSPIKIFTDRAKAEAWLLEHINQHNK